MRLGLMQKDKAERVFVAIHNVEATADFLVGQAVAFDVAGTVLGNDVKLASTIGAGAPVYFAGVVGSTDQLSGTNDGKVGLANGQYGLAQVYGYCGFTKIVRMTRAASTDSFNSFAAVAAGDIVTPVSNADWLSRSGASSATAAQFDAVVWESAASGASSASATSDTRVAITTALKTFLRLM